MRGFVCWLRPIPYIPEYNGISAHKYPRRDQRIAAAEAVEAMPPKPKPVNFGLVFSVSMQRSLVTGGRSSSTGLRLRRVRESIHPPDVGVAGTCDTVVRVFGHICK